MKRFQIKSIIRAAAMYHLYYNNYRNKDDIKDLGEIADLFSHVEDDKKQFKYAIAEYAEALSPESKKAVNMIERLIMASVNPAGLTPNKFIFLVAAHTIGEAVQVY